MAGGMVMEFSAAIEAALEFVSGHKHGKDCLEAFEEAEGMVGSFSQFEERHKETAETVADKIAAVSGKQLDNLEATIYKKLVEATGKVEEVPADSPEEAHTAVKRKKISPLHAAELCEIALKHHDEL